MDEYINAVLDRSSANVNDFLGRHSLRRLSVDEEVRALRLLELQRHLMLMYTSCGWFFDEPTGPETVQVLQYAARAVQLGQQLFARDCEEQFLKRLEPVQSNIPEFGNGRAIYDRFVRPAMLDLPGVAAHYAISSFFDGYDHTGSVYSYEARLRDVSIVDSDQVKLAVGVVEIRSRITHAELDFNFAVLYAGGHNLRAGVCQAHDEFSQFTTQARACLAGAGFAACSRALDGYFGEKAYSLKSLFRDSRKRIVTQIVENTLTDMDKLYGDVYEHNVSLIGFLRDLSMPLPPILRVSSEFVLSNAIRRSLGEDTIDFVHLGLLIQSASEAGTPLDNSVKLRLRERLNQSMQRWAADPFEAKALSELEQLVQFFGEAPFNPDLWQAQNAFYGLMRAIELCDAEYPSEAWFQLFRSFGGQLGIAVPEMRLPPIKEEAGVNGAPQTPELQLSVAADG